ncbi:helix-turn-helix domain-containing protein [Anaeromyxobacter soli]|uniref:helix-turn-helix domain-containing protein n=1 Tax=Anaeromyxobacter soli TaxID=2922725 RepID=UPI0027E0B896|nr:helix-turn-helix domain-containing protein [Anaeromyxobacter sp. SG29]
MFEQLPLLLTAEELAVVLRTSRKNVYEMVRLGQLSGVVRVGRKVLFRRDRLLDFLAEREEQPVSSLGDRR